MLVTDKNDPKLKEGQKNKTGQHDVYLVLSEEERAKEFVRPIRRSYIHVGRRLHYHSIMEIFEKPYISEHNGKEYAAILNVEIDGKILGGSYVTLEELNAWKDDKRIGGCFVVTTMADELAETYARDPNFYGATFCSGCNIHLPVNEFFWYGTEEEVGS